MEDPQLIRCALAFESLTKYLYFQLYRNTHITLVSKDLNDYEIEYTESYVLAVHYLFVNRMPWWREWREQR